MSSAPRPSTAAELATAERTFPLPFRHIACCVDESDASDYALDEAIRLRALSPGQLTIVHVIPDGSRAILPSGPIEALRQWHADLVESVPAARGKLLVGEPATEVCAWARRAGVDLVVATPHHDLRDRALLGSFSGHLVRHAPTSVLLARPPEQAPQPVGTTYANIVCCVDRSAASRRALRLARRIRAVAPGRLTALTATYLPPRTDLADERGADRGDIELVALTAPWLLRATASTRDVVPAVVDGHPTTACEGWAREHGCDLMVAGAHHGVIARMVLGGFAGHLAHHAPCSVLVTRPAHGVPQAT